MKQYHNEISHEFFSCCNLTSWQMFKYWCDFVIEFQGTKATIAMKTVLQLAWVYSSCYMVVVSAVRWISTAEISTNHTINLHTMLLSHMNKNFISDVGKLIAKQLCIKNEAPVSWWIFLLSDYWALKMQARLFCTAIILVVSFAIVVDADTRCTADLTCP